MEGRQTVGKRRREKEAEGMRKGKTGREKGEKVRKRGE